jgi:hypothetical protein
MSAALRQLNPWSGAVIVKLTPIRSGSPLAFFDLRIPLFEATFCGCTLRRTRAGKLWCAPPKQRRQLPDGTTEWNDLISWDSGRPASMFSAAAIEAIGRHSPELLAPLLEAQAEALPFALPQPQRDRSIVEPPSAPGWWGDDRS